MKKNNTLLFVILLSAIGGGIAAVKANVSDRIFMTRLNPDICDFSIQATLLNSGQGVLTITKATEVPGPCEVQWVYIRL